MDNVGKFLDYPLSIIHYPFYILFAFAVFIEVVRIFCNSLQSIIKDSACFSVINSPSRNKQSQYSVSKASLCAMESLWIKSGLDCACPPSAIFAPIEVPERKICFDKINSFFLRINAYKVSQSAKQICKIYPSKHSLYYPLSTIRYPFS